jgi:ATP-dependent protease HslVU (ClpYQ) peptidase subunit
VTAVLAISDGRRVYMAADSAISDGDGNLWQSQEDKIFRVGRIGIGHAGSNAFYDVLRWQSSLPQPPRAQSKLDHWAYVAVRRALQPTVDSAADQSGGESLMLCGGGRIYVIEIHATRQIEITRPVEPHAAIGSGCVIAVGSLDTTAASRRSPESRLKTALEITQRRRTDVRAPWRWLTV